MIEIHSTSDARPGFVAVPLDDAGCFEAACTIAKTFPQREQLLALAADPTTHPRLAAALLAQSQRAATTS